MLDSVVSILHLTYIDRSMSLFLETEVTVLQPERSILDNVVSFLYSPYIDRSMSLFRE